MTNHTYLDCGPTVFHTLKGWEDETPIVVVDGDVMHIFGNVRIYADPRDLPHSKGFGEVLHRAIDVATIASGVREWDLTESQEDGKVPS